MPTIQKARDAGLMVIVLDTPLDPMDAADATFATDNRKAGELIGQWAEGHARRQGQGRHRSSSSTSPPTSRPSTTCATRASWQGFGIDVKDPNNYGDEDDPRICTHEISQGDQEKGRTAMENALQKCPDVNVVYTINEPAAAGAWEALKAVGKDDGSVLIVSIDGGCPGVEERQGRRDRRDLAAVSAQDGGDGARGDRLRQAARDRSGGRASSTPARR